MNVAIIGAGLQCKRRASTIRELCPSSLKIISSPHHSTKVAAEFGCESTKNWKEAVRRKDVDVVIVCTPPHLHAEISIAAMDLGKHVLCEKPLATSVKEAERMVASAKKNGVVLKCGFNHRHHPAILDAKRLVEQGKFGKVLFCRSRYGICGRPEYEKEWRADPKLAAGGQFMEQGVHVIDLFRWFLGDLKEVACMTSNHYFKEMKLEDDGMALFRSASGATACLHTTLVQWKNLFSFEVFGEEGYAIVEGLGGGYGEERLICGKRDFKAPFRDDTTYYRGSDKSWKEEWMEFLSAISQKRRPLGDGVDGLEALRAAFAAYESQDKKRFVSIH
ncbi:Gfo/Idh/MocA family oxidoreductase [Candidatus Woesearchaeota archaeon]|nr:Gfo/Idh/MocA family oxidoreductase [Candidatus Woesearchaeota archaeon]HIH48011.1 Gfo/Idh/MocA family oxidoreductase [Candidatus Woesearchaeota archaeon]